MTDEKFSYKFVTEYVIRKEIMNLDYSKAAPNAPNGDISVNIDRPT